MSKRYVYGMRLRPFGIGCQPKKGFVEHREVTSEWKWYWDLIVYDRELTDEERFVYSLDLLAVNED